jgi:hypothetical protein
MVPMLIMGGQHDFESVHQSVGQRNNFINIGNQVILDILDERVCWGGHPLYDAWLMLLRKRLREMTKSTDPISARARN